VSIAVPERRSSDNLRGTLAMLGAMAAFVVNDSMAKIAAAELPTGQVIFLRGLIMVPALAAFLLIAAVPGLLRALGHSGILGRCVAEAGAALLYLTALFHMPIADCTAILQFTPLALTAGAALFLGAKVGWRRWLATFAGLLGVLAIVRPGATVFNPYAALALLSVAFVVARDLITRALDPEIPTLVIVFTSTAAVAVASIGLAPFESWQWPSAEAILALFAASAALLAAQYWIVFAMRTGDIAVVAPFRYSIIVWAIAAGFLVWGEVPDLLTWAGIGIVTSAGLYTILREHRLARAACT
jgi:drug/metabolite transporter (DMT)-like permease